MYRVFLAFSVFIEMFLLMHVRDAAKGQTTQDLLQVTIISASEKTFEVILVHPFTLVTL